MKALVFRHNLAREAVSAIGGRVDRHAFVSRFAPVRLEEVDELPLPAQDWVRVETTFSGLCGSDVKQILLNGSRDNPLTALVSFPQHGLPDYGVAGQPDPRKAAGPQRGDRVPGIPHRVRYLLADLGADPSRTAQNKASLPGKWW